MSWDFKSIAVIGSGAIGLYYGGRLAQAGENVKFLLRSDYDVIRENGLRVLSSDGDFDLPKIQAFKAPQDIGPVDLVIVCWKATANQHLQEVLPPLLHSATEVLTLQNGLGNCEAIAEIVGPERVLGGLCFVCINRLSPGLVQHTAGGKIMVGEYADGGKGRAVEVVRRFKAAGIPCSATDSLGRAQWEKLIWNVPFNGLAVAQGGVTTDVLLADRATEDRIRAIMGEVVAAANAQGLDVEDSHIEWNIGRTRPMGPYKPSTMIDFVEGRELELGPIWEEPIRRAKAAGVAVPEMERLLADIRTRVKERGS